LHCWRFCIEEHKVYVLFSEHWCICVCFPKVNVRCGLRLHLLILSILGACRFCSLKPILQLLIDWATSVVCGMVFSTVSKFFRFWVLFVCGAWFRIVEASTSYADWPKSAVVFSVSIFLAVCALQQTVPLMRLFNSNPSMQIGGGLDFFGPLV